MESGKNRTKLDFLSLIISSFVVNILVVGALIISIPAIYKALGYVDITLIDQVASKGSFLPNTIKILSEDSSVMTVKDFLSFQSGFYQTVITFLIAMNGLIAGFSIFYVKIGSEDKVEEVAKKYVEGQPFAILISDKVTEVSKRDIELVRSELESVLTRFEEVPDRAYKNGNDIVDIKQQVRLISKKISELDKADAEGNEYYLNRVTR